MNIKAGQKQLLSCLECVKDATAMTSINPILSNALFRIKDNHLTMIATNHEIQITASCTVEADEDFEQLLPAAKLQSILRAFDADSIVDMQFKEDQVKIVSGQSVFKLVTQQSNQLPLLGESVSLEKLQKIACKDILSSLRKVSYAAAQQSHRVSLNGVLMEQQQDGICFIATDGHRLAAKVMRLKAATETKHILPKKTVDVLIQRLKEEGDIEISVGERVVQFKSDEFELISNIIDENYPDYQAVIPRNNDKIATLERKKLQLAMRHVTALSDRTAIIMFKFEENQLCIETTNKDNDVSTEWIDIKYSGEKFEAGFNIHFIMDVLGVLEDDMLEIKMLDVTSSILILPTDEKEKDLFSYVVMPIRL